MTAPTDELLVALVDRLRCVAGDQVTRGVVQVLHEHLGAEGVALYLLDRRLEVLHPVAAAGLDDRSLAPHTVTGTRAGEAARSDRVLRSSSASRDIIDLPISIRGERLGVCEITITESPGGAVREPDEQQLRRVAATVATFLLQANSTTDAIESARRSYDYSITAELQWQLLAPPGLVTDRFRLHAFVEPAFQISTDLYDWSLTGNIVSLALLDAAGHRRPAAQSADLALAALRTARRYGNDLAEQASLADQAIYDSHRGKSTVDALLVEIDLDADTARAIHTGSGHALRRRRGVVSTLGFKEHDPLGLLERGSYQPETFDLAPGDTLILVSDGVTGPLNHDGEAYGIERLAGLLTDITAASDTPVEVIRDLTQHVGEALPEDATVVVFEWLHAEATDDAPGGQGSRTTLE